MADSIFEKGDDWCVSNIGKPGVIYMRTGTETRNLTYDEVKTIINDSYGKVQGYMVDVIAALKKCYEAHYGHAFGDWH